MFLIIEKYEYSIEVPYYSIPTIAELIMWLYDKHGIWIYALPIGQQKLNCFELNGEWIGHIDDAAVGKEMITDTLALTRITNSPTEAYQEAIKYTLNNLI